MFGARHFDLTQVGLYLGLFALEMAISLVGDQLLLLPRRNEFVRYAIALSDSWVHGALGSLSWAMLVVFVMGPVALTRYLQWITIRDIALCGLLSALIDLDHAIAARSIDIKYMTTLPKRPFLHNTTLLLSVSAALFLFGWLHSSISNSDYATGMSVLTRLGYLLLIATITHHIRDAIRRGFNLWPLWSHHTPPLPVPIYFSILLCLPAIVIILSPHKTITAFNYNASIDNIVYSPLSTNASQVEESIV